MGLAEFLAAVFSKEMLVCPRIAQPGFFLDSDLEGVACR
jgi:hypothetical protein